MYEDYWGFKEKPFENVPDPKFFYTSHKHEEAMMRMLYAVKEMKGAAMLTGEYGSGKTLLTRIIMGELMDEANKYQTALIVNPAIPFLELLGEFIYQLGGEPAEKSRKTRLLHKLNDLLYKAIDKGKHTVLLIDEAQAIKSESIFEEIRLLLNFQANDRFLLTILFFGQPELRKRVEGLTQLKQRLAIKYHLENLDAEETRAYIEHRCKVAGREEKVFSDAACNTIYKASKGAPREINTICDISLVVGCGGKAAYIDEDIAKAVIEDLSAVSASG